MVRYSQAGLQALIYRLGCPEVEPERPATPAAPTVAVSPASVAEEDEQ